jgi:hypothetical protein
LGWSLLFACLAGILILAKMDLKKTVILYSFPLIYYLLIGKAEAVYVRYMTPIVPVLCITGAVFSVAMSDRLTKSFSKRYLQNGVTLLIGLLILLPSIYNIIKFNSLLTKQDNRLIVANWINENIPGGSSIYQLGDRAVQIQLEPTLASLEEQYQTLLAEGNDETNVDIKTLKVKIDDIRRKNIYGYEQWSYNLESGDFEFKGQKANVLPDYIIVSESHLLMYNKVPAEITHLLETAYSLEESFEVVDINDQEVLFDQQDAFYVPLAGFGGTQRPGPNIHIYAKKLVARS